ncbi:MAG: hypothetical protein Q7T33_15410 [Dehalococcoidia bacterium]|nr:hypothetical protein [Dehalococcoidia bacterium]
MRRLAVLGALAILIAATAYASSFYAVRSLRTASAQGSYRWYAGQYRCCSQGLGGAVRSFDNSLWDPANDFVADWVGVSSTSGNYEFTQIGFFEGLDQYTGQIFASPTVYEEFERTWNCDPTRVGVVRGLATGYHERLWTYSDGELRRCPSDFSKWVYLWYFKRTSWSNPWFDFTYLAQAGGKFETYTEIFNNSAYLEPANNICFGTYNNCTADPAYGLSTYNPTSKTWSLWTAYAYPREDSPYHRGGLANYWAYDTWGP